MGFEGTSVGLDVHARSVVAAAIDEATGEITRARLVPDSSQVLDWLGRLGAPVAVAYEAGPTGLGLYRSLTAAGISCTVAAPSKLVRPAGDRVKTDAKDALLLRHGHVYYGGQTWTGAHHGWLRSIRFEQPATRAAFESDLETVLFAETRRARLDSAIQAMAADSEFTDITRRLCCLRGISTLTGFALAVEIGDWDRFTGSSIGAYLGLVPAESSSGQSRRQGAITKTGNSHARRLLVEAAWHHKPRHAVGAVLRSRWEQAPPAARARGHEGNQRLHHRWTRFTARGKKHTVATTAIARELAGWCWSLATLTDPA